MIFLPTSLPTIKRRALDLRVSSLDPGCVIQYVYEQFSSNLLTSDQSMAGYKQQDAHEYFIFFVNKLHSFNGGTADDGAAACKCIIHRTFYGKLRSDVTCGQCHNITTTEDLMVDLSLDLQSQAKRQVSNAGSSPVLGRVSLESCLESFTKPEKLQSHGYRCRKCNSPQKDPMKQLCIKKLPQILCIQFKVRRVPVNFKL